MTSSTHTGLEGVAVFAPGTEDYATSTTPQNALVRQRPRLVVRPTTAEQVGACVRYAAEHGLTVVPQATGHGAAAELGDDVLLLDTAGLAEVSIDAAARAARVGAGSRWGAINGAAFAHGLLGRSGSAPDVGVTGFTFGAGAGWLTRPWGLASGALTAVDYVDGAGAVRRGSDDAPDEVDRDVVWACRGGGGVGVAVTLEFDLVPVEDLWAGYLLWPIDALDAVTSAWAESVDAVGPGLVTSLAILLAPASPLIPEELQGSKIVVLSLASSTGSADAATLLDALEVVPRPVTDTWGPSDAERLGQIHLDPPTPVPGIGISRWLDDALPSVVLDVLHAAAESPVVQVEVRNVRNDAPTREGALDRAPGSFMLHAVGAPDDDGGTGPLEEGFDAILAAARPADTGLAIGSWSDGRAAVPDALPADVRARVRAIADRVDPGRVLARPPVIAD